MKNNYLNMKFIANDNSPFDINCRFWKPETINLALICNMDDDASNYSRKIKLDKYILELPLLIRKFLFYIPIPNI